MSLAAKLEAIREGAKQRIPVELRAQMQQATEELRDSGIVEKALCEGKKMPAFALPNDGGELIKAEELLQKGPLVLSFYRGVW